MNGRRSRSRGSSSRSKPITGRTEEARDWRERTLSHLRDVILQADPAAVEEVKWRKPSNPDGIPVWSHEGMICFGNVLKNAVRLTFPRGALLNDPKKLFNTRLDSKTVRAIDFHESDVADEVALKAIILEAVSLNESRRAGV
jgi:hypothetical protein